ncbi:response regulator [Pseudomonas sp. MAFF 730085]|uniref:Response regulator n=1 Tax=Pseudomonas kitaguniensis TaxID=2607908 RepID=A0A5N7JMG8_9PSED|nr:response regulator [Pseudomonas kitaguniensis]MPQ82580.1 response regulator [Pseudomonas kitaguniensis]
MSLKFLIVEDNYHKRERVISFLKEKYSECLVVEAHSFTAGCQRVLEDQFSAIIMDMSLPTYDKSPTESGGRFRTFGGRELSRKIIKRNSGAKILFITQYESFSDRGRSLSFEALDEELSRECGMAYLGLVYYDSSKSLWKEQVVKFLGGINENTCG